MFKKRYRFSLSKVYHMNWELVSNQHTSLHEYRLTDNNKCKVVLKYNPRHQSARLSHGNHKRLFFLESAGSLSGKTIFRNEYGMETGSMVSDKWDTGHIMIDSKKYLYRLQNKPMPELTIYQNDTEQPLASCSIKQADASLPGIISNSKQNDTSFLLLSLGWYLFLPLEKEVEVNFASF